MRPTIALVALIALLLGQPAVARERTPPEYWTSSWGTALDIAPPPVRKVPPPPESARTQVRAYPAPIIPYPDTLQDQTVRMTLLTSVGGTAVRVQLANAQGKAPLLVGAAHIALRKDGASIDESTDRVLTFAGEKNVTIPPGAMIVSDPVPLAVRAGQELAVSLYVPKDTGGLTAHPVGLSPTYIASGDMTGAAVPAGRQGLRLLFLAGRR